MNIYYWTLGAQVSVMLLLIAIKSSDDMRFITSSTGEINIRKGQIVHYFDKLLLGDDY